MKNIRFAVIAWIFLNIFLVSCVILDSILCEVSKGKWDSNYQICIERKPEPQKGVEKEQVEEKSGSVENSAEVVEQASSSLEASSDGQVPEPITGLAGIWAYYAFEKPEHLFNITIEWDGNKYLLSNCTYFYQGGSCLINRHNWDGSTFSFVLHFPHTDTTTTHHITSVTGDILTGIRENVEHGTGSIVWRRVY